MDARIAFEQTFGRPPVLQASAGGRVNLIGEHTDYHEGFVFPAAIDLRTTVAAAPRDDGVVRVWSDNVKGLAEARLADLVPPPAPDWSSYVLGPFWALACAGHPVRGADVWLRGEVPLGGGLSSSASIEVALVAAGAALAGVDPSPLDVARVARAAENHFCGVPCGAMDQVASACGRAGHALLLDCRTLGIEEVPFPESWALVVADSGVRHSVAAGEYARRQRECEEGMEVVRRAFPFARTARDLSAEALEEVRTAMPEVSFRRLRHVVTENARTLAARDALRRADAVAMGRLLAGSHESLARDYDVSCPELDALVAAAVATPGVIGARMCGAGFGGNTVNVVEGGRAQEVAAGIAERYAGSTGRTTTTRVVRPAEGVVVTRL